MTAVAKGVQQRQESMAGHTGRLWFVDSARGSDGNPGTDRIHPLLTLTQAVAKAEAGDTIVLAPGGSETVTATIAVAVAQLKIVCAALNPAAMFTVAGAGTIDLMTVSAADAHVEGIRFAHTGATSSAAGILTTNAADGLTVLRCEFDDSAITTTFTGFGVEITNACDDVLIKDSRFIDCHRGVLLIMATGVTCLRPRIEGCTLFVGVATGFGICSALTGTGAVKGLVAKDCLFVEALGSGAAATDPWDGSNGSDAASGPIKFEAAVDQFLVTDCRAYSAANASFTNLANNAGAGDFVNCSTAATAVGDITSVYSDTTIIASDVVVVASDLLQVYSDTTILVSDTTVIESDTTAIHTQTTTIASDLLLMQAGYPVFSTGTKADNTIPNNTQAAGGLLVTATGGAVLIENVYIAKDGTSLTGPTNVELTVSNTYGLTGAGSPIALTPITDLQANEALNLSVDVQANAVFPFVLESGAALYVHGDDAAGTSGGNYQWAVWGRAQNSSTTLVG